MPCIDIPFYGPRGHHIENFHRKDRCTSIQMSCSKPHMVESGLSAILGFTLDIGYPSQLWLDQPPWPHVNSRASSLI